MTTVTLEEAKLHMRVDHDEEDGYIMGLVAAAETHVANFLGDGLPDPMPAPIKAAVLLLVGDLYANREFQGETTLTTGSTYSMLLAPYRSMAVM